MGSLYKRGDIYWLKYYRNGKPYRESSHTDKVTKAEKLLKKREGEIADGKLPGIYFDKVRFDDLAEDFLTDYRINNKDSLVKAERSVRYLKGFFGGFRATDVTTDKIKSYIDKRINEGLSNASINRELAALKRMFRLGAQCTPPRVNLIPHIPMLKESNVRKGFFEHGEYLALKDALPSYLKPIITFAYHSGWRKSEILGLTWDRVDLDQGIVTIDPGETKNEGGRILYLDEELTKEMHEAHSNRQLGCPYVFHRNGEPIKDFRFTWASACEKTDLKGKLFHDLRRTAIRDMVRSGIPERVAMMVSGHKTRSVFDRYNIVSDQDLREAAKKKQAYHEMQKTITRLPSQKRGEVIPLKQAQEMN